MPTLPSGLELLLSRRSTPLRQLGGNGPGASELTHLLAAALRVPDHGRLEPWRLLLLRGEARQRFAEALVLRQRQREPEAAAAAIEKTRDRYQHAPLVVVVIARIEPEHRIPEQEQLLSAGCVAFSLLLAAEGLGFGAQWVTGWAAYDQPVADVLGLGAGERVIGFIHIGEKLADSPERSRPSLQDKLSEWSGG